MVQTWQNEMERTPHQGAALGCLHGGRKVEPKVACTQVPGFVEPVRGEWGRTVTVSDTISRSTIASNH